MNFDLWWKSNKPEDMPVDCYHRIKEACRAAWDHGKDEENSRCGLIAELYPFSPHIGKQIAKQIYGKKDD